MQRPLILIPPSEGKASGGTGLSLTEMGTYSSPGTNVASHQPGRHSDHIDLSAQRAKVIKAYLAYVNRARPTPKFAQFFGLKDEALNAALLANREILTSPTLAALDRYTGVLYQELDASTLSAAARKTAAKQLVIFSGLWGILSPGELIPNYKLKMGSSLAKLGKLSTWWRPHIETALAERTNGQVVWDLLPNEHAVAWQPKQTTALRIRVKFLDEVASGSSTKLVAVAHWNKLLKGSLVRHLLSHPCVEPAELSAFKHPRGYLYEPSLTTETGNLIEVNLVAPLQR